MSCVVDAFDTENHIYIDRDAYIRAVTRVSTAHKVLLKTGPGGLRVVLWRRWGAVIYIYFFESSHLPSISFFILYLALMHFPLPRGYQFQPTSELQVQPHVSPLRGSSNETHSPSPESPHE